MDRYHLAVGEIVKPMPGIDTSILAKVQIEDYSTHELLTKLQLSDKDIGFHPLPQLNTLPRPGEIHLNSFG